MGVEFQSLFWVMRLPRRWKPVLRPELGRQKGFGAGDSLMTTDPLAFLYVTDHYLKLSHLPVFCLLLSLEHELP